MSPVAAELRSAMIASYRPLIEQRLADRGVAEPPGLSAAVDEGRVWLDEQLGDLLAQPYAEQRRGPLEVFQAAMKFPTAALAEAGVEPVVRDDVSSNAIPGDLFDLAPASSADLGEETWRAHLAWGAEKAASIMGAGD